MSTTETTLTNSFITVDVAPGIYKTVRYDQFVMGLLKPENEKDTAMHIGLGVCGEAGELADAIKKEYTYGKPRNRENIVEELGDLRFYMQACQNHYGITEQEILQGNAIKLGKRYAGLFYSDEAAISRADKSQNQGE